MKVFLLSCLAAVSWLASALAQTNDSFAGRLPLTGSSATAVSNNLHATRETGEPNHAASAAGRSLWWTWTAPSTGVVNVSTFGGSAMSSGAARSLAIYTGSDVPALSEVGSSNASLSAYPFYASPSDGSTGTGTSLNLPVTAGTVYQIAVDAAASSVGNSYGDDGTTVLCINTPPTITSTIASMAQAGVGYEYDIQASNNPTAYGATGLPTGLSLNPATGVISGVPSALGVYSIGLSATGPGGIGTAVLTLEAVTPPPAAPLTAPVISADAGVHGLVGVALSYSLYSGASFTAGNLPPGLSLNATSGQIAGTPTSAGTYLVPVTATNVAGTSQATITFDISAAPPPPDITSALTASGYVGSAFYYGIYTETDGSTGYAPTGYAASGLPPGLSLTSSGAISGTPTQTGIYPVAFSVTNGGGTRPAVVTITINAAPPVVTSTLPPRLSSNAAVQGQVGSSIAYQLTADNAPTSFTAGTLPPGLSFQGSTGTFSGTPTAAGQFTVPVSASNAYGTSTGTLTLTVLTSAQANAGTVLPVITSPAAVSGYVGQPLSYILAASYGGQSYDFSAFRFSVASLPAGLSINGPYVTGTPTTAGNYALAVSVTTNNQFGYPLQFLPYPVTSNAVVTFTIKAGSPPAATLIPVITSAASANGTVGTSFNYSVSGTNSPTSYTATGLPAGLSISATTGTISGTPTASSSYAVNLAAANGSGTGTATLMLTVGNAGPPVFSSYASTKGSVGSSLYYYLSASPSPSSYGASNLPAGLTLDTATGTISGTPTTAGVYRVPVTATGVGGTANATLTVTISPAVAGLPLINSSATAQGTVGNSLSYYYLSATNSPTGYTANNLPPGVSLITNGTGTYSSYLSGTPTTAGTYNVSLTATNSLGTSNASLTIVILPLPAPTLLGNGVASAPLGSAFTYQIPSSGTVTGYTASNLPPGLSVSTSTGSITGNPTTLGSYSVPISAANSSGTASATLTINVVPAGPLSPPVITSAAGATGLVQAPFSYVIQASNSPTSYGVSGLPPGLTFNASTGIITGKPTVAQTSSVTISATNSVGTSQAQLNLAVAAQPTEVPIFTSFAQMIAYPGETFCYPVVAANLSTSISVSGLPTGATFDASTGYITGAVATAGNYAINVSASNALGVGQATLTLTVLSTASSAHLTSPATAIGTVGQAFSYAIKANATLSSYSYSVSSLPNGLALNPLTGMIVGKPTTNGTTDVVIHCSVSTGTLAATIRIVIGAASGVPVITSAAGIDGSITVYQLPVSYLITATNSPTIFTVDKLPAGLSLDAATGLISGVVSTSSSTFTSVVTASNSAGTGAATLTFNQANNVNTTQGQITGAANVSGSVGTYLSDRLTAFSGTIYNVTYGNLPPGLSSSNGSTLIVGTPTVAGTYTSHLTITSNSGSSYQIFITFKINASPTSPPVFTSPANAAGAVGSPFTYTAAATLGAGNFSAANLPPGLNFDAGTLRISGTPTAGGTFPVTLTSSNAAGNASAILTLVVFAPPPRPPTLSAGTPLVINDTVSIATNVYQIQATDYPASYAAGGLPPGLSVDAATGSITGTPTSVGSYPATVSATNAAGTSSAVTIFNVASTAATTPVITGLRANDYGYTGIPFGTETVSVNHATGYAASGLPPGLTLDPSTGSLTGTPTATGHYQATVSGTNAVGTSNVLWTVDILDPAGAQPVLYERLEYTGALGQAQSNSVGSNTFVGSNSVVLPVTYAASGLPPGLSVIPTTSNYIQITGTPTAGGVYPVTVTASNAMGASSTEIITYAIPNASPVPVVNSSAGARGTVGTAFAYYVSATPSATSFSASGLPAGLSLNATTGAITGTPTAAGTSTVPVTAANATATGNAVLSFQILPAIPDAPVITSAAGASAQDVVNLNSYSSVSNHSAAFSYTITATQYPTSFSAGTLPAGLSLNPVTGVISGLPAADGVFQVPITAINSYGTGQATLTIVTSAARPVIQAALVVTGNLGGAFNYPVYTNLTNGSLPYNQPPDHAKLTFAAAGLPPGLSLNTATGLISGTATQLGTYPVTVTATNREGTAQAVVTFVVSPATPAAAPTTAPSLYGDAVAQGFVGVPLSYDLFGIGATSYNAAGLPAGLSLNAATGYVTGTPTTAGTFSVPITATNPVGSTQATLTVAVDPAPVKPYAVWSAADNATIGQSYDYPVWFLPSVTGMPSTTSVATTTLPAGLSLTSYGNIGYITGTPTGPAGTVAIGLSGSVGAATGTAVLTLTILPASTDPTPTPLLSIPAGALGLLDNPLVVPLGSRLYAPNSALPDGIAYLQNNAELLGEPTTAATSQISLTAPGPQSAKGTAARRKTASKNLARTPSLTPESDDGGHQAILTLTTLAPDLSLPRLLTQPLAQAAPLGGQISFTVVAAAAPAPVYQWFHNGAALNGANASTLTLSNLQAIDTGNYTVTVSNLTGSVTSSAAFLTVQTNYATWQAAHFSAGEISSGLGADTYDFNGDGVPNLIEYALGRDPRTGLGGSLPSVSRSTANGALSLAFRRDASNADLDYVVEGSVDLRTWTIIASSTAGAATRAATGTGTVQESGTAGTSTYSVVVTQASTSGRGQQFMRLRVNRH